MPTPAEKRERLKEDLREHLADFITDERIGQKVIADSLGIKQCSVSRFFGYSGDLNLDVSDVPMLTGELAPLGTEVVNWLAKNLNLYLLPVRRERPTGATLVDELLTVDAAQGRIAQLLQDGLQPAELKECRKTIAKIMMTLGVMTEQIDNLEKKQKVS
jgi:predicted XRE-type DNA-binding protein